MVKEFYELPANVASLRTELRRVRWMSFTGLLLSTVIPVFLLRRRP